MLLTAIWNTQSGAPPQLSLTDLQPIPESRAHIRGGASGERSLALRLHIGLPGAGRLVHPYHVGVRQQPDISLSAGA